MDMKTGGSVDAMLASVLLDLLAEIPMLPEADVGPRLQAALAGLPGTRAVTFLPAREPPASATGRSFALATEGTAHFGTLVFQLADADAFGPCELPLQHLCANLARLLQARAQIAGKVRARTTALRHSEQRFRDIFNNSPDPSWLIEHGQFTDCNRAAVAILGYACREEILQHPSRISPEYQPDGSASFEKAELLMQQAMQQGVLRFEWEHRRADGSCFPAEVTLARIDMRGHAALFCVWRDITNRKQIEKQAYDLAFFDPLTSLPNRRLLHDRLDQAMAGSARSGQCGALLYLDLDHFKIINDTRGHGMGDRLLVEVAARLALLVRKSDTVARMGGDEFVLLVQHLDGDEHAAVAQASHLGEKVLEALSHPCVLDGVPYQTGASVGIAMFCGQATDAAELLKRADLAMYQAKAAGRGALRFFDPEIQAGINARAELETQLRLALERDELVLHYQPQVDASGRCVGVEALVRWQHPQRGLVHPGAFIPLAEETGLIVPMGDWVLRQACAVLAGWQAAPGTDQLVMAVNVSARQFYQEHFVDGVCALLDASGINPARLKLEITESMLLGNIEQAIATMQALRMRGVGFSLDDFGTGYSSLNYVKRLPIDQIKIDQSFVRDIHVDANDAAICRAVIAMGRSLGLSTLAEGVETRQQWEFLAREGCDAAQGYLYARPMPQADLQAWLVR